MIRLAQVTVAAALTMALILMLVIVSARAEKVTVLCGDIEAIVTVNPKPTGGNKIDIYLNENLKLEDQRAEIRDGASGHGLYLNDKPCIVQKHWICPNKENEVSC